MRAYELLRDEIEREKARLGDATGGYAKTTREIFMYRGYAGHFTDPPPVARAHAIAELFRRHEKHIYENDLFAGSLRGLFTRGPEEDAYAAPAAETAKSYGSDSFWTGFDHFAPDYETLLAIGVGGLLEKIKTSREKFLTAASTNGGDHGANLVFLHSAEITLRAFGEMIRQYGEAAAALSERAGDETRRSDLSRVARACGKLRERPPETLHEALQLVWLTHTAFLYEGRYAMALGRMDRYLYPFYANDLRNGLITDCDALELLACFFMKITEHTFLGNDDVVNICVGGTPGVNETPGVNGARGNTCAVNELSYRIVEAVMRCGVPGPNLSARIAKDTPDSFLDACLISIGTGLGYPALMNDEINVPALMRRGYAEEDCRDYCMVGCIENFIAGKQPPWSDGRFNTPKYIELALNNGVCMLTGSREGPDTGAAGSFATMDFFLRAVDAQMEFGAARYMSAFINESARYDRSRYAQPFLSCFCADCIERGADINDGGARYPSAHGVGCMGIGTFADSMAAIEQVVFTDKLVGLGTLRDAMLADFDGYGGLRAALLRAPKYGNNDDRADKYAVRFVEQTARLFDSYKTRDGGPVYTAIAANVQNIDAGKLLAASPDGRKAKEPLSDAASPTYGADFNGPTAVVNSVTKPDYTLVSCGTVLNQKYTADMFKDDGKRARLLTLIKTYFAKGGQEIQINAVGKDILTDAVLRPEIYRNLIVRVSGFSARFVTLAPEVQRDILRRTEHG